MIALRGAFGILWANQRGRKGSVFGTLGSSNANDGHRMTDFAPASPLGAGSSDRTSIRMLPIPHPHGDTHACAQLARELRGDLILLTLVASAWHASHAAPTLTSRAIAPTDAPSIALRETGVGDTQCNMQQGLGSALSILCITRIGCSLAVAPDSISCVAVSFLGKVLLGVCFCSRSVTFLCFPVTHASQEP